MLILGGSSCDCRGGDIVASTNPPKSTEQDGSLTFSAEAGNEYVVWSDYSIKDWSLSFRDEQRYCYDLVVEVSQGGKVVSEQTCRALAYSGVCQSGSSLGNDCPTDCRFKVEASSEATLRTKFRRAEPCRAAKFGMYDIGDLTRYRLYVVERK